MPTPTCGSMLLSRQVQQLFRMNSRISVLAGRIEFVTYKYKNNNGNILLCVVPGMQGPNSWKKIMIEEVINCSLIARTRIKGDKVILHSQENQDPLFDTGDFGDVGEEVFELEVEFLDDELFFPSSMDDFFSSPLA